MNLIARDGSLLGAQSSVLFDTDAPGIFKNSKKSFLRYLSPDVSELPQDVKDRVMGMFGSKSLRLNHHILYATKRYGGGQTFFFQSVDKEEIGVTNINNGRLDENRFFVATAMAFLYARVDPGTPEETTNMAKMAVWEDASKLGELLNSELFLRIDSKHFLRLVGSAFKTAVHDREATVFFDSPIMLPARTQLELEVREPKGIVSTLSPETDFLRVEFYGKFTDAN